MTRILFFISISLVTLFSCQQKKEGSYSNTEENSFNGYIPPEKLDSLLNEKYLLNTYYILQNEQRQFNFHSPIASAKIYEDITDEKGKSIYPDYPEHLHSEIFFTKSGRLSSLENINHKKKLTIIYNDKNLISFYIEHEAASSSNEEEKDDITEYKYDNNGNLLSSFQYKKTKKGLYFWHYTEYKYFVEKGNIIVLKNRLEKFASYYFNKSKLIFDSQKRLIKKEDYSQNVLARGREITSENKYFYENPDFPKKITKIEMIATTDNSGQTETFQYNKEGNLINYLLTTKPETYITSKKNNYLAKNKIEYIHEHKTLKSYQVMGVQIDPDEQKVHETIMSDDFGNILLKENIKKKKEKNYIKNTYKFDHRKNWIEKLVNEHSYIPKEYLNKDVSEDSYIKYRREINYSDFKENTMNTIDTKEAEQFKKKILDQEKFYETSKNLN